MSIQSSTRRKLRRQLDRAKAKPHQLAALYHNDEDLLREACRLTGASHADPNLNERAYKIAIRIPDSRRRLRLLRDGIRLASLSDEIFFIQWFCPERPKFRKPRPSERPVRAAAERPPRQGRGRLGMVMPDPEREEAKGNPKFAYDEQAAREMLLEACDLDNRNPAANLGPPPNTDIRLTLKHQCDRTVVNVSQSKGMTREE